MKYILYASILLLDKIMLFANLYVLPEMLPEDVDDLDFTVDSIFQDVDNIEVVDWNLYGARPRTRPRPSSVLSSPPRTRHRVREEAGPASRTRSQSSM